MRCKHIFSVQFTIERTTHADGTTTITQTRKVTIGQNWPAYTKAQNEEVKLFDELLKDLVQNVPDEAQKMGRPRIPNRRRYSAPFKRSIRDYRAEGHGRCIGTLRRESR